MKKIKNSELYKLPPNYGSESVDITLYCRTYLLENNYLENNVETNINLLKRAITNYSIIKMAEWNIDLEKIQMENIEDLSYLSKTLNDRIPTKEEQDSFFAQYIHCIIYIYSQIVKQEPMIWKKRENEDNRKCYIEIETKTFVTDKSLDSYKIPNRLLEIISLIEKLKFNKETEKNPILIK